MTDTGEETFRDDPSIGEKRRAAGKPARSPADRTATLRAAHADLVRRTARLERANAELEAFGQALAHDLSEGVATIALFAEALEATVGSDLDEAARRELDGILAGVERTHSLISSALRSVERKAGSDRGRPVNTDAVLRDALANLHARRERSDAKVIAEPLPPVTGDGPELIRLFQNLLANSIRFRDPSRPVQVRVGARREGRRWRFEITDNGLGIDHVGKGSMPGQPSDGSAAAAESHGNGLTICRRIVEAHGGRLRLEPGPERRGTTVSFDLPAVGAARTGENRA